MEDLPSLYVLLPCLFVLYQLLACTYSFYKNLRAAQASGVPYIIAPFYDWDRKFQIFEFIWGPIARSLPTSLTEPWLSFTRADWAWHLRRAPFEAVGSDTIIVVNYKTNAMTTCDPEVINQITTRRNDFLKPIEDYAALDLYGKNVVTVEGTEWRRHRKATGAQFNEKSNQLVWKETLFQTEEMVRCWLEGRTADVQERGEEKGHKAYSIADLSKDTMKMTLHVISRAGFGVRCLWPGAIQDEEGSSMSSTKTPEGHRMTYVYSLEYLLQHVVAVIMLPGWFLTYSPFKILQEVALSLHEWGKYMHELYVKQVEAAKAGEGKDEGAGLDLMGTLVRNSVSASASASEKSATSKALSESEILGNAFVMFLAGHETAANTLFFAIVYVAMRPDIQRKLQAELDDIFGDKEPHEWDYDTYLPKLFAGWAGAIMNEELRILPPVLNIPKSTWHTNPPQALKVNGKDCLIAPGTHINLNASGAHRNPKYWPAGPPRKEGPVHWTNTTNDLDEFKPERWFVADDDRTKAEEQLAQDASSKDTGVDLTPDTAASMFRPPKGAYIPFSDGFRACLGRRFAQVEILGGLAVVFKKYSVELYAGSDEEIGKVGKEERTKLWHETRKAVEKKINEECSTIITLQMRGEPLRLRVCKRGEELYDV